MRIRHCYIYGLVWKDENDKTITLRKKNFKASYNGEEILVITHPNRDPDNHDALDVLFLNKDLEEIEELNKRYLLKDHPYFDIPDDLVIPTLSGKKA